MIPKGYNDAILPSIRYVYQTQDRSLYKKCRDYYNRGMKSIVSEKGQVIIPKSLRKRLGLTKGTVLNFEEENGQLIVSKVSTKDPVVEVYGIISIDTSTDKFLEQIRDQK